MNVVHLFPYSVKVSGGHTNAIRAFIDCQRASGINAVGIAPELAAAAAETDLEFPLAEVASLGSLRWLTIARRFNLEVGNSLLHFHSVGRKFIPLIKDLRVAGVPFVFTSHGQLGFRNAGHWFLKLVYLNVFDRSLRKAAGLHLLTECANRQLKLLLPGYPGLKLVQGHPVTAPNPAAAPAAARSDYGIPGDVFVLIFLGRLDVWTKGLDLLVTAFASLPAGRFRLVIVGPDWNGGQAKLERQAEQLGCRDGIHFLGPVYGAKKYSLLRMADAFVSPSRHEAFGITLIEALLCDRPLVTSIKLNLAPELSTATAALITPLTAGAIACALARLAAEPELRHSLARKGKTWAELNCDPSRTGARFREFYQSISKNLPTSDRLIPRAIVGGA